MLRAAPLLLLLPAAAALLEGERYVPVGVSNDQLGEEERDTALVRSAPTRLARVSRDTVNTANDWHFAMMNDIQRNTAFEAGLQKVLTPESVVIDIGAGSGLLSVLAAKQGAKKVYAIEGNKDLFKLAQRIVAKNGLEDVIEPINRLSTMVTTQHIGGGADVLVSEVLGTLLLGESALEYMADARKRLLRAGGSIVPAFATQYATVITSEKMALLTSVQGHQDVDLTTFNELQDTSAVFFSKQLGVRLSDIGFDEVSPALELFSVDFYQDSQEDLPSTRVVRFNALRTCTVHAIMFSWQAWLDKNRTVVVSTHPNATKDNLQRDMAWGQALQNVEDLAEAVRLEIPGPVPFRVTEGEALELRVNHVNTYSAFHATLRRATDATRDNSENYREEEEELSEGMAPEESFGDNRDTEAVDDEL
eukprot:TRINITY_DN15283_c0_g1_i1.p1 TRINITY_DN15283_c0_g1~~TRINITY_DN15283_c0_g1_i1.p1  ORF type:complete len:439 (+),score=177.84 TRINITY_DN15283_c0_g1_i1:60-1319(+)